MKLIFQTHDYSVTYAGEKIQLLRKEFALLQHLYNHPNQTFTRDDLLDAVWLLEAPSDRTVDDHIYRLRKKLKDWNHLLTIETVKGYGYQLVKHQKDIPFPLAQDEEFKQLTSHLFSKYHLFGHGEALNTLLNQEALGFEIDQQMKTYISFMRGDVWDFVKTDDVPFSNKALYLIHIYIFIANDKDKVISLFEEAKQKNIFSEQETLEATILTPGFLYILGGKFDQAKTHLEYADSNVTDKNHGFYPFLRLTHIMYNLCIDNDAKVQKQITYMEKFLKEKPYQRELGLFHLLKGLFRLKQGNVLQGRKDVEEGFSITQQTRFKSHIMLYINVCLFYLEGYIQEPALEKSFRKERDSLDQEYDFKRLEKEINQQFQKKL
ncbi:winged helix-turn-helix domain-containing protein [Piscibacillus sp. B03]|uniref:winged helix-turn-helix domain-containing protein n=1 Tax=Piscibacillus sp. B03 TaxID=3457430 RepID=UPI003FCCEE50